MSEEQLNPVVLPCPLHPEFFISDVGVVYRRNKQTNVLEPIRVYVSKKGRCTVSLTYGTYAVARLVLEAFVRLPRVGEEARHSDNNQTNNRLSNLRWDTEGDDKKEKCRFKIY